MAEQIKQVFAAKKAEGEPAFVTFVTAGYPKPEDTVPNMLALEAGGADIIELGIPFSDPTADGPTIQAANTIAINNDVTYTDCLEFVRQARSQGLKAPVMLMDPSYGRTGYYNPILSYGEEKAVQDAREAGANGFIVVDLPPEEAVKFRAICASTGYGDPTVLMPLSGYLAEHYLPTRSISYVPLIAPSTSIGRVKFLAGIADSFIYVVSKMGTTGSTREAEMNTGLPEIIARIRAFTPVPLAVGFGVSTRVHFEAVTASGADAVVVGSRIIDVIRDAPQGQGASALEAYCREITLKGQPKPDGPTRKPVPMPVETNGNGNGHVSPALPIPPAEPLSDINPSEQAKVEAGTTLPARFGAFGGQYVAEALVDSLTELEEAHKAALADPEFWKEFEGMYTYMNRPSNLYEAERLTEYAGGAKIWLK
ncbi:hypothetical protein QFC19_008745 [Naganishia cerealis]|uniref:Uncharacterized protein n=1 Tax=Naganishia cerealis TaxID=610337 RepID=A0ACC2V0D9_9TREE|nr:hypothetical protein QFC19_008745 [Naganishia cerealis]